ncbi:MAG TPA: bifunctional riboflavin kinase/FAD synthetase, partial [Polyangiaceae bacterium]|nr:bifunctional riboflavin kinase/FAD synthetase [Polyangiaceae bacterium]
VDGAGALGPSPGGSLVAIGNFDGVHKGHRAVISAAAREARERALVPRVLTFHPHPAEVLGRPAVARLTTLERKIELITDIDPDVQVVVEPFTHELSLTSPEDFVRTLLVSALWARVVIVGENFRFGHRRMGDLATLQQLGRSLGFEARAAELVGDAGGRFSSSRVRQALAAGDLAEAAAVLGRPHSISGRVVVGAQRGRTIGVPTANLGGVDEALPPFGVYACAVDVLEPRPRALGPAVANIGLRPTVQGGFSAELHLLDFDGDLYGTRLRAHLLERLREERKFDGLAELERQIRRDIEQARGVLAARLPALPAAGPYF